MADGLTWTIGPHLRRRRKKLRLTQMQVAGRAGVSQTMVSKLEQIADQRMNQQAAQKVAQALGLIEVRHD